MKSKNIPADIKKKTIKEAQAEIKEIILELDKEDADLEKSMDKYIRMIQLRHYVENKFKK